MTPKAIPPTPRKPQTELTEELKEQIRPRAYQLYEERGRAEGHELEDWLQAEAELAQKSRTVAA